MSPHFFIRCSKLRTALGLAVLSVLLWTHPAWATTRTVDTLVDNASLTTCSAAANDCSLRGALSGASANDTINFDPSLADQTITLALGELAISQPVTIDGSTALTVTVSGNNTSRVISTTQPLTVTSMIIANGLANNGSGGGIYTESNLWLIDSVISNSVATGAFPASFGGGALISGTAYITGTSFLSNTASFAGGGVAVSGATYITEATFLSNTAGIYGGGMYVYGATSITGTRFFSNTAGTHGGGVFVNGDLNITGTIFLNNISAFDGGGAVVDGSASIIRTSFLSNTAQQSAGAFYILGSSISPTVVSNSLFARNRSLANQGDAIYIRGLDPGNRVVLQHNTFANPTMEDGAAIYVEDNTVAITNTLIASHTIAIERVDGAVSEDYSLFADVTTPFSGTVKVGTHSITGTAAFYNTTAYTLTANSAALDAGVNAGITSDYFGDPRPQRGGFDIGYDEAPFTAAVHLCFTSLDGTTTYASSADSQAVRNAVAAAASGSTVHVAGNCAGVAGGQLVNINKPLTLIGGYQTLSGTGIVTWSVRNSALYSTTLDALGSGRVISTSQPLTVENLIIQNGLVNGRGGGIYAENNLWLNGNQISNCMTSGSFETGYGGGVYVAGAATITGTIFISNSALSSDGGGLYVTGSATVTGSSFQFNNTGIAGGGAFISGTATITGTTFINNNASGLGGGLHAQRDTTIDNSTFIGNVAQGEGGGVSTEAFVTVRKSQFISNTGYAGGGLRAINFAATIEETLFQGNLASDEVGGGVYVFKTSLALSNSQLISNSTVNQGGGVAVLGPATITATLFQGNSALVNGGGAYLDKDATVTGSTFFGNNAHQAGGGVYLKGNTVTLLTMANNRFVGNRSLANQGDTLTMRGNDADSRLTFTHNTLANSQQEDGAAIYVLAGTVDINNTIIANHAIAIQRLTDTVREDYNLFDTVSKPFSGTVKAGAHSIIGTAAFVDAALNDYHLLESSAAIDMANASPVLNDFDGTARPQATAPDIGAFESSFGLPTLSIGDGNAAEGNSGQETITLPITLSFAKAVTVTANFNTSDGSAQTSKNDYVSKSGVVQLPPGTTTTMIDVNMLGDTLVEGDENFQVLLTAPRFATLAKDTGMATIVNDDDTTLNISDATVGEGDNATSIATFVVGLTGTSATTITVNYATSDDTASSDIDYLSTNNTLTFAPGIISQKITVTVKGDNVVENNESFTISLSNANGATIGDGVGTGTILNDDNTVLNIGDASVIEGDNGTVNASFKVTLTTPSDLPITAYYTTSDVSATVGSDYINASGTFTFAPGITSQTITVTVNSDRVVEGDESFKVTLSNANGATIGDGVGTGTINNDDSTALSIGDGSVIEGDSGTVNANFTVTLTNPSATIVTVHYETSNGTASSSKDYLSAAGTLTFAPNITTQTITVTVEGDQIEEADESFTLTLSRPNGATLADNKAVGTIIDDDKLATLEIYLPLVMR